MSNSDLRRNHRHDHIRTTVTRLLELLNRLVSGTISPAEQQRLEELLKDDPEARHTYYAFMDLDRGLHDLNVEQLSSLPFPFASPPANPLPKSPPSMAWLRGDGRPCGCRDTLFVLLIPGLLGRNDSQSDPDRRYARQSTNEAPPPSGDGSLSRRRHE